MIWAVTSTSPSPSYVFYQTNSVERTVISTRAGDDEVHGDPSYKFPNVDSEWGISPGDYQQQALIGALEIYGGDGNDRLFGGALNDYIHGGAGIDLIMGGGGDDTIDGGPGNDLLAGDRIIAPDLFELVTRDGVTELNDLAQFAQLLPTITPSKVIDGLSLHEGDPGDWYLVRTPTALKQFGANHAAQLLREMIGVEFSQPDQDDRFHRAEYADGNLFLFAAQGSTTSGGQTAIPIEQFAGVPEYYLLHVVNVNTFLVTGKGPAQDSGDFVGGAFDLYIDGVGPYTVSLPSQTNVSVQALVDLLNTELTSDLPASVRDQVVAVRLGDRVALSLTRPGQLEIRFASGSAIAAAYRFENGQTNGNATQMGEYRLVFAGTGADAVGGIIDVPADGADASIQSDRLADQAVIIPLGDINGDGFDDFIASIEDDPSGVNPSVAKIYFGGNHLAPAGTLDATSKTGVVVLDRDYYEAGETVRIRLTDADLTATSITVQITSTVTGGVDTESVQLNRVRADEYEGSIATIAAGNDEVGKLALTPGGLVTVTYNDANNGSGAAVATDLASVPVTLNLPAPLLAPSALTTQVFIAEPGDYNGDGRSDIAIAYTRHNRAGDPLEDEGVYLLFGSSAASAWDHTINLLVEKDVLITGMTGTFDVQTVGDIDGDGRADFAVIDAHLGSAAANGRINLFFGSATKLSGIYHSDGTRPAGEAGPAVSTRAFSPGIPLHNHAVRAARNLNGDLNVGNALQDFVLTGPNRSHIVLGRTGTSGAISNAATLQINSDIRLVPLGDIDNDGLDDLGVLTLEQTQRLTENGTYVAHQVAHVFLGGVATLADLVTPEMVIEPSRPTYSDPAEALVRDGMLGALGNIFDQPGTVGADFAVAEALGGQVHLFFGRTLTSTVSDPPASTQPRRLAPELFTYGLATPVPPGTKLAPNLGANLSSNPNPASAFALEGVSVGEALSSTQLIGDVNRDGVPDLLVAGALNSYIFRGPVNIQEVGDVASLADIIVDAASLGRPALRQGDVNGDGIGDLTFIRDNGNGTTTVTVLFGGDGLPRVLNADSLGVARRRIITFSAAQLNAAGATVQALNFNGDALADLLIVGQSPTANGTVGYIFSGADVTAGTTATGYKARLLTDNDARMGTGAARLSAVVAGDVNGDGLDDVLLADSGFVVNATSANQGRAYLLLGRTNAGLPASRDLRLNADTDLIVQDVSLSNGIFALGDLNNDGYDDFAVSRSREDASTAAGGLFVVYGGPGGPGQGLQSDRPNALSLNNDLITLPHTLLNGQTDLTVEFWFQTDAIGPGGQAILSAARSGQDNEFLIFFTSATQLSVYNQGAVAIWNITNVADGQWRHFAVSRDNVGNVLRLYVNGSFINSQPLAVTALQVSPGGLFIGQDQDAVGGAFDPNQAMRGKIDDLRIWSFDRFQADIQPDFQRCLLGNEAGLRAYYPFDEADGFVAEDRTGHGFNGTLSAGVQRISDGRFPSIVSAAAIADITVFHAAPGELGSTLSIVSSLSATAGDFDGDGALDLAIGRPSSILTSSRDEAPLPGTILDRNDQGQVFIFWGAAYRQTDKLLLSGATADLNGDNRADNADVVLAGELSNDRFGTLPLVPVIDLDGDRIDDLLIGAAGADVTSGGFALDGGRVYVIYGTPRLFDLPSRFEFLANRTITGSGDFLVDRGTGQPDIFDHVLQPLPGSVIDAFAVSIPFDATARDFTGVAVLRSLVYVLDSLNSDILVMHPLTREVLQVLDIDSVNAAANVSTNLRGGLAAVRGVLGGDALIVVNDDGQVLEIDPLTGVITSAVTMNGADLGAGLAIVGGNIYAALDGEATIGVFSRSGTFIRQIALTHAVLALGADGDDVGSGAERLFAILADGSHDIVELNTTTGAVLQRFAAPQPVSADVSLGFASGSLYFMQSGGDTLHRVGVGAGEVWFRFTTLGDGMAGNSIRLTRAAADSVEHLLVAIDATVRGGAVVNTGGDTFTVGGSNNDVGILEFDLSRFFQYMNDPALLEQVVLQLDATQRQELALPGSSFGNLTVMDGRLYFTAQGAGFGIELWSSNGSASGTVQVSNIHPGSSANPSQLTPLLDAANNRFNLFFVTTNASGQDLYRTSFDGANFTTTKVSNFAGPRTLSDLIIVGDTLYFTLDDGGGVELWRSNAAGTAVTQIAGVANPTQLAAVGTDSLYFVMNDGTHGDQLFKLDRATSAVGVVPFIQDVSAFTRVGTAGYFLANGGQVWKLDATGPTRVGGFSGAASNLINNGVALYFTVGSQLWSATPAAGATSGTQITGFTGAPSQQTLVNGTLFFVANSQLRRVTGATAALVSTTGTLSALTAVGDTLFFLDGSTLKRSTTAGTGNTVTGFGAGSVSNLRAAGPSLVFNVGSGASKQVWTSDTGGGVAQVIETVVTPVVGDTAQAATLSNGTVLFTVVNGGTTELWSVSTGGDVTQVTGFTGTPGNLTAAGSRAYFTAGNRVYTTIGGAATAVTGIVAVAPKPRKPERC